MCFPSSHAFSAAQISILLFVYEMGCAGSKSTPVVEANTDMNRNSTSTNGTVMQKVDDIGDGIKGIKENIGESKFANNLFTFVCGRCSAPSENHSDRTACSGKL